MKRYFFLALVFCFSVNSSVQAQRDSFRGLRNELRNQGRQVLQQQLNRFQDRPFQGGSIQSIPSESGRGSGGSEFAGGDHGFILPGNGGGQFVQPGRQIVRPGGQFVQPGNQFVQPGNHFVQPGGQIVQPGRQIVQPGGQYVQPGGQYVQPYPGGNIQQSQLVQGTPYSSQDLPGGPVTSSNYIMLRVPATASGSITYTLSSDRGNFGFTMSAGQEQRFKVGSDWIISYHNGTEQKRYKLEGGRTYNLVRNADSQWLIWAAKLAGT